MLGPPWGRSEGIPTKGTGTQIYAIQVISYTTTSLYPSNLKSFTIQSGMVWWPVSGEMYLNLDSTLVVSHHGNKDSPLGQMPYNPIFRRRIHWVNFSLNCLGLKPVTNWWHKSRSLGASELSGCLNVSKIVLFFVTGPFSVMPWTSFRCLSGIAVPTVFPHSTVCRKNIFTGFGILDIIALCPNPRLTSLRHVRIWNTIPIKVLIFISYRCRRAWRGVRFCYFGYHD